MYSENLAHHKCKQCEQEPWRTLVKIRCITQVVLLFGFPAVPVIQSSSPPPGKILGWDTKHSYEEQERREKKSIISFSKVSGRKKRRNRNQLDFLWRLRNSVQKREITQGNKGPGNKTKDHESSDVILPSAHSQILIFSRILVIKFRDFQTKLISDKASFIMSGWHLLMSTLHLVALPAACQDARPVPIGAIIGTDRRN